MTQPQGEPLTNNASPTDVNLFHRNADVDTSATGAHHTLGIKPSQAAAGSHKHDGVDSNRLDSYEALIWMGGL